MFHRLMKLTGERGLEFGVKITNTFPVDVKAEELPSQEMYMSGRSLYPLSLALAARLAREFKGKLRISYSGGADIHSVRKLYDAGIWPITMATTILKPGGYQSPAAISGSTRSPAPWRTSTTPPGSAWIRPGPPPWWSPSPPTGTIASP